jgi:gamma-glutamylcyclotransferase
MSTISYLAYGSNLHPVRLIKRVPSATVIDIVEIKNSRIVFHKKGIDDSGKCMLVKDAAREEAVHGVLYAINENEQALLDRAEGCGNGYLRSPVKCLVEEMEHLAFTYVAEAHAIDPALKPYHWYKALVLAGARHHKFPEAYISRLDLVESIQDSNIERRATNEQLLSECEAF